MARASQYYTGDGSRKDFPVSFEGQYLSRDYVKVYTRNSKVEAWTMRTDFAFVGDNQVRLASAPPSGQLIMIRRETPGTSLVNFQGQTRVTEKNLDIGTTQGVQVGQEAKDLAERNYFQARDDFAAVKAIADAAKSQADAGASAAKTASDAASKAQTAIDTVQGQQTRIARLEQSLPGGALPERMSGERRPDDQKPVQLNGAIPQIGAFAETIEDELSRAFTGENVGNTSINQTPVDLGETVFIFPDAANTVRQAATMPSELNPMNSQFLRIVPVDIRTVMVDSLLDPGLFEAVETNLYGMVKWKYTGNRPLRTILKGSIQGIERLFNVDPGSTWSNQTRQFQLVLRALQALPGEMGGVARDQLLAMSPAGWRADVPFRLLNVHDITDYCRPLSAAERASTQERNSLTVSGQPGYFSDSVFPNTDALNTSQPGYYTTNWIDLATLPPFNNVFCLICPESNRCNIRYKTANGTVRYWDNQSHPGSANFRPFRLPNEAVAVQVCYAYPGYTGPTNPSKFVSLEVNLSYDVDGSKGFWVPFDLHICRDITLFPNVTYCFDLFALSAGTATSSGRVDGYRILSGGLSCMTNLGAARKAFATTLYRN